MAWDELIKGALAIADRVKNAELHKQLAELSLEMAKLTTENGALRKEASDLRAQLETHEAMHFRQNAYWRRRADGTEEGPCCPKCYGLDSKASRMLVQPDDRFWRCPVCDFAVERPDAPPLQIRSQSNYDPYR